MKLAFLDKFPVMRYSLVILAVLLGFGLSSCKGQTNQTITPHTEISEPGHEHTVPDTGLVPLSPPSSFRDSVMPVIARFEKSIAKFEAQDIVAMPDTGMILFVGSSSIRGWKTLVSDFSGFPVLGRGFGGSTLPELIYYAPRIIYKYKPKAVVLYCGENDMTLEYSSYKDVIYSFDEFYRQFRDSLPNAELFYISIKPCPYSWNYWPKIQQANADVERYISESADPNMHFIDIRPAMLLNDSTLDSSLFAGDGIHINAAGYVKWTEIIRSELGAHY